MNNDPGLQTDVLEELEWRPGVDATHIGVTATDGIRAGTVLLFGSVGAWAERDEAVWAAWSALGATMVDNHLTITP